MNKNISIFFKKHKQIFTSVVTSVITVTAVGGMLIGLADAGIVSINFSSNQPTQVAVSTGTSVENSKVMAAVAKANPAVVSIVITKEISSYQSYNPFSDLFGDTNSDNNNGNDSTTEEVGGGSGFFVSSDGYIVTNNHVVRDTSADYTVVTTDDKQYSAKVLATDSTMDVAVLKIEGSGFPYLTFADSSTIKLGQTAIAIGNALAEFDNTISLGIVSGLSRTITASDSTGANSEQLTGVIQTDAAINSGNSGGPLLDIAGNVIGVNVAVESSAQSIGFALPSNIVKSIADSVKQYGEIRKPYLGIRYVTITDSVKKSNNLSVDYGALVSNGTNNDEVAVIPNSPADKAGIVENDIILEIDGVKITEDNPIAGVIRQKSIGQTITIKLLHQGQSKEIKATLEKAPTN